jgi:hypothetical protein
MYVEQTMITKAVISENQINRYAQRVVIKNITAVNINIDASVARIELNILIPIINI